jgi:phage internal scaffolding protein
VRNPYNYDTNQHSDHTALHCPEPTLTQQSFAEEVDINFIANRYGLTGEMPQVLDMPAYGDFTGIFDFQTAQNAVIEAQRQFMTLPAKLRTRFDNDPQKLLTFLEDPDNKEEAMFLGIISKPTQAEIDQAHAKDPAKTPPPQKEGENPPTPPKPPTT